jgi:DeoR family ulaG and ulaABCDEF operon transcriptional repressor
MMMPRRHREENLESDRHEAVIAELSLKPFLSIVELQEILGVSAATVRRDIAKLSSTGVARKVHGGIAVSDSELSQKTARNLPFFENRDIAVHEKTAIAETAAGLVRDGSIVMVHAGSTCFQLGRAIADRNIRVITNSHPLAAYLGEHGTCQLTIGGGDLYREPGIFFDPAGLPENPYASQFLVGALGVGPGGVYETNPLLVRVVGEMIQRSNEVIVLVDSRKFETKPTTLTIPHGKISCLVTDENLSDSAAKMLEDAGVDFKIAEIRK